MNKHLRCLCKNILELARLRRESVVSQSIGNIVRREVTQSLIVKQFENVENELVESLTPVFREQIQEITTRLLDIEVKTVENQAHVLASLIFDPQMWTEKVIAKAFPVMALNMARAGVGQILVFGIDIRKSAIFNRKQTTATEWLESHSEDYDGLLETFEGTIVGTTENIRFMSEIPIWMKRIIMKQLAISFAQDYWREISITTQKDAEAVLRKGLANGWSIRKIAREMTASLGGTKYARMRATRIARTEAGNSLNGMRSASIDKLMSELGPVIPMKKTWLSVLADTTRDSHADLDGVPENEEGLWNLDGVSVPWPAHYTLPPENRVNCLCSIFTELGLTDEEANRLIAEHEERISLQE